MDAIAYNGNLCFATEPFPKVIMIDVRSQFASHGLSPQMANGK